MRVFNRERRDELVHGPFSPVHFNGKGISEEVPADVVHYLCRFPGYRPYKGEVKSEEPTQATTKNEILAFCDRKNIGGVSEEMTKRQLLEHIHKVLAERRGEKVAGEETPEESKEEE